MNNVYVRVSHDGRLSRDPRCTVEEQHAANFIVVRVEGRLVIWKDRYGRTGRVVSGPEADNRAYDHVEVAMGRKSSRSMLDL